VGNVTESIYSGEYVIIPMREVCFIQREANGAVTVVMSGSTWNSEIDAYNNAAYLHATEAESFKKCWCRYRHELELDDLKEIESESNNTSTRFGKAYRQAW
jgi:hypothetical protein